MRGVWLACLPLILFGCGTNPVQKSETRNPAYLNAELGLSYMQSGNYDLAMVKLKKALAEDPRLAAAHHYLAELYRRTGNEDGALESYEDAVRLAPDDPMIHGNYATYRCDRGDYEIAEEAFEETIRLYHDRRRFGVHEQAAACAIKAHDSELAERHLREALKGNPKSGFALYQMARLMYQNKHYMQARGFMQRLDIIHEGSRETWELGRDIEKALNDPDGVAAYQKKLSALSTKVDQKGTDKP